jgi:hypothetical protein
MDAKNSPNAKVITVKTKRQTNGKCGKGIFLKQKISLRMYKSTHMPTRSIRPTWN